LGPVASGVARKRKAARRPRRIGDLRRAAIFRSLAGVPYPTAAVASKALALVNGTASRSYLSLAGISSPVAGTKWIYLKLAVPWTSDASTSGTRGNRAPAYAVIDGIVYLTGSMRQPTTGSRPFSRARTFTSLDAIAYPQNS
jgi:hypothetical protein